MYIHCADTLHVPRPLRTDMLPIPMGCVHLSVSTGCGGTTWALQQAKNILMQDSHVIWVCDNMPDGQRFSQIFKDLPPASLSRLHVSANGENTEFGVRSAAQFLTGLSNLGLVVVDNWAPKSGQAPSGLRDSMNILINTCDSNNIPLLAISAAYEDANNGGWKARFGLENCEVWFLHKNAVDPTIRELHTDGSIVKYLLGDDGFSPRN